MLNFLTLFGQNHIKQYFSCSLTYQNPLLVNFTRHTLIAYTSLPSKHKSSPSATVETPGSTFYHCESTPSPKFIWQIHVFFSIVKIMYVGNNYFIINKNISIKNFLHKEFVNK